MGITKSKSKNHAGSDKKTSTDKAVANDKVLSEETSLSLNPFYHEGEGELRVIKGRTHVQEQKIYVCIICKYPIEKTGSENRNLFFESENLELDIIEHNKEYFLYHSNLMKKSTRKGNKK